MDEMWEMFLQAVMLLEKTIGPNDPRMIPFYAKMPELVDIYKQWENQVGTIEDAQFRGRIF